MNGLGKSFRTSDPKNWKKLKIKVKLPHVNKKPLARKRIFCSNTVFSLYFKFRAKKFPAAKPLAFSLHFLFRRDQNHCSNLTSKMMKMCEQILKKRQRPNTNQIPWIVKKLAPLRTKNDVSHAPQLKLHERMNKRQIWSGCDVIWS